MTSQPVPAPEIPNTPQPDDNNLTRYPHFNVSETVRVLGWNMLAKITRINGLTLWLTYEDGEQGCVAMSDVEKSSKVLNLTAAVEVYEAPGTFEFGDTPESNIYSPTPNVRTVTIPSCAEHGGWDTNTVTVRLVWCCPVCGAPRGDVFRAFSYDGSRRLAVDSWRNACGHVQTYEALRREADANCLNGVGKSAVQNLSATVEVYEAPAVPEQMAALQQAVQHANAHAAFERERKIRAWARGVYLSTNGDLSELKDAPLSELVEWYQEWNAS